MDKTRPIAGLSSAVHDIDGSRQLILDGSLIGSSTNAQLTMHEQTRTGEILVTSDIAPERPEPPAMGSYSTALREGGRTRIWYFVRVDRNDPATWRVLYAESEDGLHFQKPALGLVDVDGSTANNVVINEPWLQGCCVWIDPHAPPAQRYRTQAKGYKGDLVFHASPDGLRWQETHRIHIGACDTQNVVFWDERSGRYVLYTRAWEEFEDRHLDRRMVRRLASDDLHTWVDEGVIWEADSLDLEGRETITGQPPVDYYGAAVYRVPGAGDLYVMLAQAYWHFWQRPPEQRWGRRGGPDGPPMQILGPGAIDARLAVSRDGLHFSRAGAGAPFLRLGPAGAFDSRMVWALPNPVPMGDEIWFYYAAGNRDHEQFLDPAASEPLGGIGRAVLRADGYQSLDADHRGGEATTVPLRFSGSRLEVNLDTSGGGVAMVDILDEAGEPIPGFSGDAAAPLWGNSVHLPVSWREGNALGSLAGRPVRLRFRLRDCRLYAFQFLP